MKLHRIGLKYFIENPAAVVLSDVIPVFHRWIAQSSAAGLLIDVADYAHVQDGPGVVLIGHECDYSLDSAGGRTGLTYLRKRDTGDDLAETLRTAFRALLPACGQLEQEPELGSVHFRTDEVQLSLVDRLAAPNTAETFAAVRSEVEAVLSEVYPDLSIELELASADPRECLTIAIRVTDAPPLGTLVERV